jgi:hypothetical protein
MRYRGAYEYDKFILNTMQFHNEIDNMLTKEMLGDTNYSSLLDMKQDIESLYNAVVGDSLNTGILNTICKEMVKYKEG